MEQFWSSMANKYGYQIILLFKHLEESYALKLDDLQHSFNVWLYNITTLSYIHPKILILDK